MAKKKAPAKRAKRKTLARKTGVSQQVLSNKIAIVRREDPGLTSRAAAGKAHGILKQRKRKKGK